MGGLCVVYGWLMGGLWVVYGWFKGTSWRRPNAFRKGSLAGCKGLAKLTLVFHQRNRPARGCWRKGTPRGAVESANHR
eukprot:5432647-Pyramimonas_sp.AAC.1